MIKSPFILVLFAGLAFSACGNGAKSEQNATSNLPGITENENKGIKEIMALYGGQYKCAKGTNVSINSGKRNYFKIEIRGSEVIEKYANVFEMPASNAAYLIYRNLGDEKKNYDIITIVLVLKNGSETIYDFPTDELEVVVNKMPLVNKFLDLLNAKNFEGVNSMLTADTSLINYDRNEFITRLRDAEPKLGPIKEFIPYGFRFTKLSDGREVLHISGMLLREIQNIEFSADIDLSSRKEEIIKMNYKL